jgi:hypothetical protein
MRIEIAFSAWEAGDALRMTHANYLVRGILSNLARSRIRLLALQWH